METYVETLPRELLAITSPEEITPHILVLVKQHCDGRLSQSSRQLGVPLNNSDSIGMYWMMLRTLRQTTIQGEDELLELYWKKELQDQ